MKTVLRQPAAVWLTAAAAALFSVAAVPASAGSPAYKPRLIIIRSGQTDRSELSISTYIQYGAPRTAEVDLYVPAAYAATLDQAPGTQIGAASADAQDRGLTAPFTSGTIVVANPTDYAKSSCDSAGHTAVWLETLKSETTTFSFPIFVRASAGQPTELHWCLPTTAPQLVAMGFGLSGVFDSPATGSLTWDARFTPYDPATGTENAGAQVSSLVTVRLPQVISLAASYSKKTHTYHLIARATEDGHATPGEFRIYRSVGDGPFITSRRISPLPGRVRSGVIAAAGHLSTSKVVRFRVHFTALPANVNCGEDIDGVPCVDASDSGWEKDSNVATIHP